MKTVFEKTSAPFLPSRRCRGRGRFIEDNVHLRFRLSPSAGRVGRRRARAGAKPLPAERGTMPAEGIVPGRGDRWKAAAPAIDFSRLTTESKRDIYIASTTGSKTEDKTRRDSA